MTASLAEDFAHHHRALAGVFQALAQLLNDVSGFLALALGFLADVLQALGELGLDRPDIIELGRHHYLLFDLTKPHARVPLAAATAANVDANIFTMFCSSVVWRARCRVARR